MKRITIKQLKEAYKLRNRKPARGAYFPSPDTACPIGILFFDAIKGFNFLPSSIIQEAGYEGNYVNGFIWGWEHKSNMSNNEVYNQGYLDGQKAAKSLLKE